VECSGIRGCRMGGEAGLGLMFWRGLFSEFGRDRRVSFWAVISIDPLSVPKTYFNDISRSSVLQKRKGSCSVAILGPIESTTAT